MKQTAALMQKLLPAAKDLVSAALGSESGNSQSGVTICVAREAFVRTMEDVIQTGRLIATNAFNDLGLPPDQVNIGLMRAYMCSARPSTSCHGALGPWPDDGAAVGLRPRPLPVRLAFDGNARSKPAGHFNEPQED